MVALIWFVLAVRASPFKSKSRLEAENAVLRHQLIVLQRKVIGRAHLTNNDRWFFVQMYRWFPSILKVVTISRIPNYRMHSSRLPSTNTDPPELAIRPSISSGPPSDAMGTPGI